MATDNPESAGEGAPFLQESEKAQQRSLYNSYYTLLGLNYTHQEALKTMRITQAHVDHLLQRFGPESDESK
ncbi:MAG: hypothetical protein IPN22_05810 [Bacteroidetes bacterium]|nr:hypothetical protein [Bacteroidota bacterium]